DDGQIAVGFEKCADTLAHENVIVDDDQANRFGIHVRLLGAMEGPGAIEKRTLRRVPPAAAASIENRPCGSDAARSRMLSMPMPGRASATPPRPLSAMLRVSASPSRCKATVALVAPLWRSTFASASSAMRSKVS